LHNAAIEVDANGNSSSMHVQRQSTEGMWTVLLQGLPLAVV
jgi:hypothetical protein